MKLTAKADLSLFSKLRKHYHWTKDLFQFYLGVKLFQMFTFQGHKLATA